MFQEAPFRHMIRKRRKIEPEINAERPAVRRIKKCTKGGDISFRPRDSGRASRLVFGSAAAAAAAAAAAGTSRQEIAAAAAHMRPIFESSEYGKGGGDTF